LTTLKRSVKFRGKQPPVVLLEETILLCPNPGNGETDVRAFSVTGLSELIYLIRRKKLSPSALMESLLRRIDSIEPQLKAWRYPRPRWPAESNHTD